MWWFNTKKKEEIKANESCDNCYFYNRRITKALDRETKEIKILEDKMFCDYFEVEIINLKPCEEYWRCY